MHSFIASLRVAVLACALLFMAHTPDANAQTARKVGIYYALWHCPLQAGTYNLSNILESDNPGAVGPIPEYHWWGKPKAGYYCLSQNDKLLQDHATLLKAAGIDFIYVDITNWPDTKSVDADNMIVKPFERLLEAWRGMGAGNTPKIVPWVRVVDAAPINDAQDMIEYVRVKMTLEENLPLALMHNNKPRVFVAPVEWKYATAKIAQYAGSLATQKMWAQDARLSGNDTWGFISLCSNSPAFKQTRGQMACNQPGSADVQQISVAPAFSPNWMSNLVDAVPKFNGMTLLQQMETARLSDRPFVMITGWNEWIAQRLSEGGSDYRFTDQYNQTYNRDLEPAERSDDLYYDLLKRSISALRSNTSVLAVAGNFGPIKGIIDGVSNNRVNGWACSYGARIPVEVHLYVGGSAGVGTGIVSETSDFASTSDADRIALWNQCGSDGRAYRFSIRLPLSVRQAHQGKKIYIHGIHPTNNASLHTLLNNSGVFAVPAP